MKAKPLRLRRIKQRLRCIIGSVALGSLALVLAQWACIGAARAARTGPTGGVSTSSAPGVASARTSEAMMPRSPLAQREALFPTHPSRLIVRDLVTGRGHRAVVGDELEVVYTGWIYDATQTLGRGAQFTTNVDRRSYRFRLGDVRRKHVKGWEEGLVGIRPGGKRRIIVPSSLGYGATGVPGKIQPGTDLMFEVELVEFH